VPDAIIKLDKVSWTYSGEKKPALNGVSLEIEKGSIIAVTGRNGAGKSSFCRLLNGLIPHSIGGRLDGTVTIDGADTRHAGVASLTKITGMAFEDSAAQLFTAGVYDEAAFALENLLYGPEEIAARVRPALEAAGLWDYRDYSPSSLSGGQKQRLTIAAALAMAEKILVLDEPVSQLDPAGAAEILSFIRDFGARKGLTVVMATNSGEAAAEFAEKIAVFDEGKLAAFKTPKEIFSDRELRSSGATDLPQVSEFARLMEEYGRALPDFPVSIDGAVTATLDWYDKRHG